MKYILTAVIFALTLLVQGCKNEADVASENLSQDADNFQIERRIVFYDSIQGAYLLSIEGRCSIQRQTDRDQLAVTCKIADAGYKKHYLGLSSNVTYFVEQLETAKVGTYRYKVTFKPSVIVPDINVQ